MQPNYVLDQAEWDKLISDTAYYFDDLTLKRGFNISNKTAFRRSQSANPGRCGRWLKAERPTTSISVSIISPAAIAIVP